MTEFWILAGLLLVAVYALFLPLVFGNLPPRGIDRRAYNLWVHRQRHTELADDPGAPPRELDDAEFARDLLADYGAEHDPAAPVADPRRGRTALFGALMVLPLCAVVVYLGFGRLDLAVLGHPPQVSKASEPTAPEINDAIAKLEARLAANPNDAQGWLLLGRSYQAIQQTEKAAHAYETALGLQPDDLNLKALYAETLAELKQGSFAGKPAELIQAVLKADPQHPMGLWLAGMAAANQGDSATAARHWQTLLTQLDPASDDAKQLKSYLEQVGAPPSPTPSDTAPAARDAKRVQVHVELAADLKPAADPEATVFIFARAAEGPPMPLAIAKKRVKDLPVTVTLSDDMAMMPGRNLSAFPQITLNARVSKSGTATPAPGDLQGSLGPLAPQPEPPYQLVIDQKI